MEFQSASSEASQLLDINSVAQILGCSDRHVKNLSAKGKIPDPVKLGALVRWSRSSIENWISAGCPDCSEGGLK